MLCSLPMGLSAQLPGQLSQAWHSQVCVVPTWCPPGRVSGCGCGSCQGCLCSLGWVVSCVQAALHCQRVRSALCCLLRLLAAPPLIGMCSSQPQPA